VPLAALALLLAVLLLAVPSVRTALPGMTQRSEYTNPVIRWDFADPSVLKADDGWYYAYSTENLTVERLAYIQAAHSRDLVNWELLPDAMPEKPEWANTTRDFWAPGVIEVDGRYYMYFSGIHDKRDSMCLGVATSDSPGGPFVPEEDPLRCGDGFENIDPMPFDDPQTGKSLLYWGSDGAPIRVQPLARDRLKFARGSSAKALVYPDVIQPYERLVEGAFVVYRDGYYYLFYSGDNCCSPAPSYRAERRLGPARPGRRPRRTRRDGRPRRGRRLARSPRSSCRSRPLDLHSEATSVVPPSPRGALRCSCDPTSPQMISPGRILVTAEPSSATSPISS
jgi:arabinan endo-1,5-alpha-L-arabinosidase